MRQFGTDLTPTCDRCGKQPTEGMLMDLRAMTAVCFGCLTPEEVERFKRGKSPFGEEEDE